MEGTGFWGSAVIDGCTYAFFAQYACFDATSDVAIENPPLRRLRSHTYAVATFRAAAASWSDTIDFTLPDNRFVRQGNKEGGTWAVSRKALTLTWDTWGNAETTTSDGGYTFTAASGLTLSSSSPPDWFIQLFDGSATAPIII
jgi:hypothetical protein